MWANGERVALAEWLKRFDDQRTGRRAYACFEPYGQDAQAYARATDMAAAGMVATGQLARERYGDGAVVLVGFGSHRGSVIAGRSWGAPMERMEVPIARAGSWEDVVHDAGVGDALPLTDRLPRAARERRGHDAIGVVYDPTLERYGNDVLTDLPRRYDAFVHIDTTRALHPLHVEPEEAGPPATYPWGL